MREKRSSPNMVVELVLAVLVYIGVPMVGLGFYVLLAWVCMR